MKKALLYCFCIAVLCGIIAVAPAVSKDFSAFQKQHCLVIEDVDWCMFFSQAPWGPGWNGNAYLSVTGADDGIPIIYDIGYVRSMDGINVSFDDVGFLGYFDNKKLRVFHSLLTFVEK